MKTRKRAWRDVARLPSSLALTDAALLLGFGMGFCAAVFVDLAFREGLLADWLLAAWDLLS